MVNVVFIPATRETEWVDELLPGTSPAELPVAGRRVIDYAIERAQKFGAMFTEILDWRFSQRLADLEGYSSPLTANIADDLVVVWGIALSMHAEEEVALEPVSEAECVETPAGIYRRSGGRWMRLVPHGLVVRNVKAWHELNFVVLSHPEEFTVPGYSSERDVHIGRSVVIEHGTEVKPPVLLQDNTWFARNVQLEGEVIVDSGSYISEGARLRRTVVCRDTFIGAGLELIGKIVVGRRVIDAGTGTWVDFEEPGLARRIPTGLGWVRSMWRFLRGRSYGRRG